MRTSRCLALAVVATMVVAACAPGVVSPAPTGGSSAVPAATSPGPSATATPTLPNAELTAALDGAYTGTTVDVFGPWTDALGASFDDSLEAFRESTGVNVLYSGIANYASVLGVRVDGGLAPDIAELGRPEDMRAFQADGQLIPLTDVLDMEALAASRNPSLLELATVDGDLYGLFYTQDVESIVWYPVEAFADKGYEVPTTWGELGALSDRIVADGSSPWCTSMEHGEQTGWVATDWLEDIVLRSAGTEVYDRWVTHEIPFDDPAILAAAELMRKMWFTEDYVYGGDVRIEGTWVGDSQTPMFDEGGPKCWLHKQAAWIADFWPKDGDGNALYEPGVDSSFFALPPIDPAHGSPVVGSGEMFVMFDDRPEVRALMQWLSTADAVRDRVASGSFLAADNSVPAEWYTTYPVSGLAEIARTATALRFDGSDSMPKDVGNGTFWTGMVKWVAQNGDGTAGIFAEIEASWP
jgi:alpha-glucoside transport system substrate-binding protein